MLTELTFSQRFHKQRCGIISSAPIRSCMTFRGIIQAHCSWVWLTTQTMSNVCGQVWRQKQCLFTVNSCGLVVRATVLSKLGW